MKTAGGEIPHPNGTLSVAYKMDGSKWNINILLPAKTSGTFVWKGKTYLLKNGDNKFRI